MDEITPSIASSIKNALSSFLESKDLDKYSNFFKIILNCYKNLPHPITKESLPEALALEFIKDFGYDNFHFYVYDSPNFNQPEKSKNCMLYLAANNKENLVDLIEESFPEQQFVNKPEGNYYVHLVEDDNLIQIFNKLELTDEQKELFNTLKPFILLNKYKNNPESYLQDLSNFCILQTIIQKTFTYTVLYFSCNSYVDEEKIPPQTFTKEELYTIWQLFKITKYSGNTKPELKKYFDDEIISCIEKFLGRNKKEVEFIPTELLYSKNIQDIEEDNDIHLYNLLNCFGDLYLKYPGITALYYHFGKHLSFESLKQYFPEKSSETQLENVSILLKIKENSQDKNQAYMQIPYNLHGKALNNDLGHERYEFSNKRMILLQAFYIFLTTDIISYNIDLGNSSLLEIFLSGIQKVDMSKKESWATISFLKELLNYLSNYFNKSKSLVENYKAYNFDNVLNDIESFEELNKSSSFPSNQSLLYTFYTISHTQINASDYLLKQLEFVNKQQELLLPLKKYVENDKGRFTEQNDMEHINQLKLIDTGFNQIIHQNSIASSYTRPMSYRIWQETEYNPDINDHFKSYNATNYKIFYFYSIGRNMSRHLAIHRTIDNLIKDNQKLREAIDEAQKYLDSLECYYKNNTDKNPDIGIYSQSVQNLELVSYYKIKLNFISNAITKYMEVKDDQDKPLHVRFDLKRDFGTEFYNKVVSLFEDLFISNTDPINQCKENLSVYLIYIALTFAKMDAKQTTESKIRFNISSEEETLFRSFLKTHKIQDSNAEKDYISYYYYKELLKHALKADNLSDWDLISVNDIAKLQTGQFDQLPEYFKFVYPEIINQAKKLLELQQNKYSKNDIFEAAKTALCNFYIPIEKTETYYNPETNDNETYFSTNSLHRNSKFKLKDILLDSQSSFFYNFNQSQDNKNKIHKINNIRQKLYTKQNHIIVDNDEYPVCLESQISIVYNNKDYKFEFYLGKKLNNKQQPLFTLPAFSLEKYNLYNSNSNHSPVEQVFAYWNHFITGTIFKENPKYASLPYNNYHLPQYDYSWNQPQQIPFTPEQLQDNENHKTLEALCIKSNELLIQMFNKMPQGQILTYETEMKEMDELKQIHTQILQLIYQYCLKEWPTNRFHFLEDKKITPEDRIQQDFIEKITEHLEFYENHYFDPYYNSSSNLKLLKINDKEPDFFAATIYNSQYNGISQYVLSSVYQIPNLAFYIVPAENHSQLQLYLEPKTSQQQKPFLTINAYSAESFIVDLFYNTNQLLNNR